MYGDYFTMLNVVRVGCGYIHFDMLSAHRFRIGCTFEWHVLLLFFIDETVKLASSFVTHWPKLAKKLKQVQLFNISEL